MSSRPSASSKALATELAQLLFAQSNDVARKEWLLSQLVQTSPATGPAPEKTDVENKMIGIWTPYSKFGKTYYKRCPTKRAEWPLWADVHEIAPKGKKRRIVLLGESAARGFLYDPYYNLAKELSAIFSETTILSDVEVIDLAKVSLLLNHLTALVESCVELQPDAVVIFAGNNWVFKVINARQDYHHLLEVFATEGSAGLKKILDAQTAEMVTTFLQQVEALLVNNNIPVVFVVPECNLLDWRSHEAEELLPSMPEKEQHNWHNARTQTTVALTQNNMQQLEAGARQMINIDASNPVGHRMLASYHQAMGNLMAARTSLETAHDCIIFKRSAESMPRCLSMIKKMLAEQDARTCVAVVNLPEIMGASLPDRRWFLDNCHLTLEGIKLTATHITRALLKVMHNMVLPVDAIAVTSLAPDKHAQAIAYFCAAVYNAHYGQSADIVQYHCDKAIALSPDVQDTMKRFVDFSGRTTSNVFCKTFEDIILDGAVRQFDGGFAFRHYPGKKLADYMLVDCIARALQKIEVDIVPEIHAQRLSEHAVGASGVSLLTSFYAMDAYYEFFIRPQTASYQARSPKSRFRFVTTAQEDLLLTIDLRLPVINDHTEGVRLYVNHQDDPFAIFPARKDWRCYQLVLPKDLLQEGGNELTIVWPCTFSPLETAGADSEATFLKKYYPLTGEVFSLRLASMEKFSTESLPDSARINIANV